MNHDVVIVVVNNLDVVADVILVVENLEMPENLFGST